MRTRLSAVFAALSLLACPTTTTPDGGSVLPDGGTVLPDGGKPVVTPDGGATSAPQLTSLTAQVSSRTGRDLTISVVGKDRDLDIASLWVALQDEAGAPVNGIDTDRDGTPDTAETPLPFASKKLVGETLTAAGTLVGVLTKAQVKKVTVTLLDATGQRSEPQTVAVTDQPVRVLSSPCDPTFLADRCAPGLGCRGTPSTCQEGLPPTVARLAFFRGNEQGPTILVEGTEPEDDLSTIRFEFKNAQGQSISVDSNGDGTPDLASFDYDAVGASLNGAFFVRLQAGAGLDTQVPTLVATGIDSAGHTGVAKTAAPSAIPVRTAGATCDARGFDVCGPTLLCSPMQLGAANKCVAAASLRATECAAAPVLVATTAGATWVGATTGLSRWDAPSGCSSNDPRNRPDTIVKVRLTQRTNALTLSTVGSGTSFDTTLYVLSGCPANTDGALGCNDDVPAGNGASRLVLADMPAGDYLVVIDSFDPMGGAVQLVATVE